jgi:hypothetical protein
LADARIHVLFDRGMGLLDSRGDLFPDRYPARILFVVHLKKAVDTGVTV